MYYIPSQHSVRLPVQDRLRQNQQVAYSERRCRPSQTHCDSVARRDTSSAAHKKQARSNYTRSTGASARVTVLNQADHE